MWVADSLVDGMLNLQAGPENDKNEKFQIHD
jgi:hypothetical protein